MIGGWVIRESRDQSEGRRLDWPGIALLSGTLFSLVWGLIEAEKHGWRHSHAGAWLLTSLVVVAAFDDFPGLHHEDNVGASNRRQPVCDHDRRFTFHQTVQRFEHQVFGSRIEP